MNEPPAPRAARRALLLLSLAVLLASSTWFSATAATPAISRAWQLSPGAASWLTSSTQLGFITGTLGYALFNLADVYNPRRVFFVSALAGAVFNGAFAALSSELVSALPLRFLTGVTLAGVYPVGMKIVATWFDRGLGWRLGVMVGALTLGTAMPYLLRSASGVTSWRLLVGSASGLAVLGGLAVLLFVGDGPHLRGRSQLKLAMLWRIFGHRSFRLTALGYFGHMWELYAFWAFLASWLTAALDASEHWNVPLLTFAVIASGAAGCVLGGLLSRRFGERPVALGALALSGCCALLSPLAFHLPAPGLLVFLLLWGVMVIADSPQFSALAARHAPPAYVGTALTMQNGVGFALTIGSIQLLPTLATLLGHRWAFLALAPGPALGLLALARLEGRTMCPDQRRTGRRAR